MLVIVIKISYKQETINLLTEALKNGPEDYVLIYEGDISNFLGVIKREFRWDI